MLNTNVRYNEAPAAINVNILPDGSHDVWMRMGIGNEREEYYAEQEAYARLTGDVQKYLLPDDFDAAFDEIASWRSFKPGELPDEMQVLREKVEALSSSNDMLTECILEMSAVIYG